MYIRDPTMFWYWFEMFLRLCLVSDPKNMLVAIGFWASFLHGGWFNVKLLGIVLDKKLNFLDHFKRVVTITKQTLGIVTKLGGCKEGMTKAAVRSFYVAYVRPIIEYGLEIWYDSATINQRKELETIKNLALWKICGAFTTTPVHALQQELAIPPLTLRVELAIAMKTVRGFKKKNKHNPIKKKLNVIGH